MWGAFACKFHPVHSRFITSTVSPTVSGSSTSSIRDYPPASRVFVRNLSHSTTETSLRKAFSNFGQIIEVKVAQDDRTKKSKGFAFVQYSCLDEAILALEQMDQKFVDGKLVCVEIAKPSKGHFSAYPKSMGPPLRQTSQNVGAI